MAPDSAEHRRNSFDALRLAAAVMVVVGHCYVLSGRSGDEPLIRFTGLGGFGELGVSVFFVISGFLVAASWLRLQHLAPYLANRVLRIVPGLAVATLLTALVLGPAMTRLGAGAYFAQARTWLYPLRNTLIYPVTYALPGVFEANPYPDAVNGSLWTLRLEFSFYLLFPLLAAARLMDRRGLAAAALIALLAYFALLALGPVHAPAVALIAARNGYLFLAGAALHAWREVVRPQAPRVLIAAVAVFLAGAAFRSAALWIAVPLLPLVVVGLGLSTAPGVSGPPRFGDLSYGIYIYAFPVQQALIHALGPQRLGIVALLAATMAIVTPLAAFSWWVVERPALRLKPSIDSARSPRRRPALAAPPVGTSAAP